MADPIQLKNIRYTLFNSTAPRYNRLITPALGPLAASLITLADPQPDDRVLDLGTATGVVAILVSKTAASVTGVDFAPVMLPLARQSASGSNIAFYQGDIYHLPHPANTFSLALASFSFNSVEPAQVLPDVYRVLHLGGRLVFQEWGDPDEAGTLVKQTIKAHRVEKAKGEVARFRLLGSTPKAWDELGSADDIIQFLQEVGFTRIEVHHTQAAVPLEAQTFYDFRTAWAPYQAELAAMPAENRRRVESEILAQLNAWAGPDGRFIWKPALVQMVAYK